MLASKNDGTIDDAYGSARLLALLHRGETPYQVMT